MKIFHTGLNHLTPRIQSFFFFKMESHSVARLKYSGAISAPCNLYLLGSSDFPCLSLLSSWDYRYVLSFRILVQVGFHHVGQDGPEILGSSDPPALAS